MLRLLISILIAGTVVGAVGFQQTAVLPYGLRDNNGRVKGLDANHDGLSDLITQAPLRDPRRTLMAFFDCSAWNRFVLRDSALPINRDSPWDTGYLDDDSLVDVISMHGDPDSFANFIAVHESPDYHSYPTLLVWRWRYEVNGGATYPMMITDLDQDGKKEILAQDCYVIYVFENVGDNDYRKVYWDTIWEAGIIGPDCYGDFDQDGRMEFPLVASGRFPLVYECTGDNQYQEVFRDTLEPLNTQGWNLTGGHDLDQDGKPEIIISSIRGSYQYFLTIYESIGDNRYDVVSRDSFYTGIGVMSGYERSSCGDIDSDGQDELVWAVKGNWLVYKATGNNQYEKVFQAYPTWNRRYTTQTCIYDFNQNGYPEVVESGDSAYAGGGNTVTFVWEIEGVRLHRPNGGEVLQPGSQFPITWEKFSPPGADSFSIFVSYNNALTFETITTGLGTNDTLFLWSVPDTLADSVKIMIWAYGPPRAGQNVPRGTAWDFSDSVFSIRQTRVREAMSNERRGMSLRILQNPTTTKQGLRLLATSHTPRARLLIYDVAGKLVQSLTLRSMPSAPCPIALDLSAGVYFLMLATDNESVRHKLVVLR